MSLAKSMTPVLLLALCAGPGSVLADRGERTYRRTCVFCHADGASGAPRKGDAAAWAPRIEKGRKVLYRHALDGFRAMPARGADRSLTDSEVRAAVDYLIEQAGE